MISRMADSAVGLFDLGAHLATCERPLGKDAPAPPFANPRRHAFVYGERHGDGFYGEGVDAGLPCLNARYS